jgi:hypothetical protein
VLERLKHLAGWRCHPPGATLIGWTNDGYTWYGTYNSGGSWIGVGENFNITIWAGWATFSCTPRWMLNANGQLFSYNKGC